MHQAKNCQHGRHNEQDGAGSSAAAPPGAVSIDGSQLEGGGQILRNAVALAAITRTPVHVDNIRAGVQEHPGNFCLTYLKSDCPHSLQPCVMLMVASKAELPKGRRKPGLAPQHLTGLNLVAAISGGHLQGGFERSTAISYTPAPAAATANGAAGGRFTADTKTAGSCTLMVQQALPCLLFASGATRPAPAGRTAAAAPPPHPSSFEPQQRPHSPTAAQTADASPAAAAAAAAAAHTTCPQWAGTAATLLLRGGTDAAFAPPIGYLQYVLLPSLRRLLLLPSGDDDQALSGPFSAHSPGLSLTLTRRGFYPKGGGEAVLQVPALAKGATLPSFTLTERGHLERIICRVFTAGKVPSDMGQKMAAAASATLRQALKDSDVLLGGGTAAATAAGLLAAAVLDVQVTREPPASAGVGDGGGGGGGGGGLLLVAQTSTGCLFGSSALLERGVRAEEMGVKAATELIDVLVSGAAVDQWLQDQLVIFMAAAQGTSSVLCGELTLHTRTAIAVVQQLLPEAEVSITQITCAEAGVGGSSGSYSCSSSSNPGKVLYMVRCRGAGLVAV